jgi:O-antigen ligase
MLALAVATALALLARPPRGADVRFLPAVAAVLLGAWAVLRGATSGAVAQGLDQALLLAGVVCVLLVCCRLETASRERVLIGLVWTGVGIAISGWLGVALHASPWALPSQGLWRASSTLTYANATAAVLVALALVTLGLLRGRPGSKSLAAALSLLLAGAGATLSRAGLLSLLVGLAVLASLTGWRSVVRAGTAPALGACLALAGLLPSMPVEAPPRFLLAAGGLLLGLALATVPPRVTASRSAILAVGVGSLVVAAVLLAQAPLGKAVQDVARVRATFDSSYRTDALQAALRLVAAHPVVGSGPGRVELRWVGPENEAGRLLYAHDEYLQILTELGAVGLGLLVALLAAATVVVLRGRVGGGYAAAWAGAVAALAALAVHSALDFIWHMPVIPLTAAAFVGLVSAPLPGIPTGRPTRLTPQEGISP